MTVTVAPVHTAPAPLDGARELAPTLAARSLEIERARTLPPDLVSRLRASGLLRMSLPVRLGGAGIAARTIVEVVEETSRADAATGWCVLTANIGCAFLGWLDPDAAGQILASDPDPVISGNGSPLGQGVREADQYRLSGRWPFASGCLHANWFVGGFRVIDGRPGIVRTGPPELRLAYFPAGRARVEDTWRVAGLAGAGSHDVVAEDIVVRAAFTSVPYYEPADHPDPLCRLPAYSVLMTMLGGFALGVGRRALDEARAQLTERRRPTGEPGWLSVPAVQVALLRHETALAAARRQVLETVEELTGEGAEVARIPHRARLAAAVIHSYDVARQAALDCFRLAGAAALFDDNPLQRCMRDLVAASQHLAFSEESRKRVAGAMLGLQTGPVFFGV